MPHIFADAVGAWHRTSTSEEPPAGGAERIRAATYEGPGRLDARIYQLSTPAAALDRVQRWKPSPDTVFFYSGRFFVVIRWQAADRKALQEFVTALEKKLPAP